MTLRQQLHLPKPQFPHLCIGHRTALEARKRRLRPSRVRQARGRPLGGAATAQASALGHAGSPAATPRAFAPRRPWPAAPSRDPHPHPASPPTHPCSAPRRSGRASGRCVLRRQTDRQTGAVSGCARRRGHFGPAKRAYSPSPGEMVSTCTPMAAAAGAAAAAAGDAGSAGGRAGGAAGGVDRQQTWRRFPGSASALGASPAHARVPARPALRARPTRRARPRSPGRGLEDRKPSGPEASGCSRLERRPASPTLPFPAGPASLSPSSRIWEMGVMTGGRPLTGWVTLSRFTL